MLTADQIGRFARNGFVQIPHALAPEICAHLVEQSWQRLPASWQRDAPATWSGEVEDSCHVADLAFRRGHMKFQKGTLMSDPQVAAGFAEGSPLSALVGSLLGEDLAPVLVRGLYCIAPTQGLVRRKTPHVEAHPIQVVAVGYLDDVHPGGGGLSVWPGSHKLLYPAFDSKLEFSANSRYGELVKSYANLQSVELAGRAGDVVLMHHRLFHAPSLNHSPDRIRFATFCDYRRAGYRDLCAQQPGPMWEDWAESLRCGFPDDGPADFDMPVLIEIGPKPRPVQVTGSSLNKRGASNLVRARKVGQTWIVLSDSPAHARSRKIEPTGSRISASANLVVNGRSVQSMSHNDIIAPVELQLGKNFIRVEGIDKQLWVKIVKIETPFEDSHVLCHTQLSPKQYEMTFDLALADLRSGPPSQDGQTTLRRSSGAEPGR